MMKFLSPEKQNNDDVFKYGKGEGEEEGEGGQIGKHRMPGKRRWRLYKTYNRPETLTSFEQSSLVHKVPPFGSVDKG